MNTWKIILATLVIFGSGVITGGLLVSYSDRAWRPVMRPAPPLAANNPRPVITAPNFLDRLDREVKVDPGQRERIQKIVVEGQARTREAWQQTIRQIRRELTPDQRARFEELMKHPRDPRRPSPPRGPATNAPSLSTNL